LILATRYSSLATILMKNILLFALFLTGTMLSAQGGIEFSKGDWNEILAQAKNENKIVFVDAYTTWCGPCKMMSRDVFPNPRVGAFYNTNFVNAKIDMERQKLIWSEAKVRNWQPNMR